MTNDVTQTVAWKQLEVHRRECADLDLRQLFARDPRRGELYAAQVGDLFIDYSKHWLTGETLNLFEQLATEVDLSAAIAAMVTGAPINTSENRAALHTALRRPRQSGLVVDGRDVVVDVHRVLDRMAEFARRVRSGTWTGRTGRTITTVVNIGIGGSDLGPAMVYRALRAYADAGITARFVANVDPADMLSALDGLDPETTLFVVSSKTFGTLETLTNAEVAKQWLLNALGSRGDERAVRDHFVAVSANPSRVADFGIDVANMFEFWDWVGGRYSVDSAIGLSVMITIGPEAFAAFLEGFRVIDTHFTTAPLRRNVPVLLGLLGVWYSSFFGAETRAVLPYSQDLCRFPAYLQQLTMESNGKSVRADGQKVTTATGEIFWGEPGTNGQHAFYQLLHQGTRLIPADFIGFAQPAQDLPTLDSSAGMQDLLMSNFFAQSRVLAFGRTADEISAEAAPANLVPHKVMPGNRPSTTILAPKLTPSVLGQLIALYEHQVFTESVIWGINAFDQWGVELGKTQAVKLLPVLVGDRPPAPDIDSSTANLVRRYRMARACPPGQPRG
ncbi:glucose-6-phosphate isomerase [Rhodococcus sp. SC4]|nr:glucose-6-phosphate isomerase [Rhodococcus sp. SC4]